MNPLINKAVRNIDLPFLLSRYFEVTVIVNKCFGQSFYQQKSIHLKKVKNMSDILYVVAVIMILLRLIRGGKKV